MLTAKPTVGLFQKKLFFVISRAALWSYRHAPIFGMLRACVGIIRDQDRVLVIRRNDGRGLSFPGGLAWPWESDETALRREIQEETGLIPDSCEFVFRYESLIDIAVRIVVFDVKADGEVRGSWEGTPQWMEIKDVQPEILRSQKKIVERLMNPAGNNPGV
jgi:8-oxo-dGTP pyrophosphatase MutT (NUDIX family)